MLPRNSAEVAIKLYDKARELGIPAKIESSLVNNSDSRYVILNRGQHNQKTIRLSSHRPMDNATYDISFDVRTMNKRITAVQHGYKWIEDYASHLSDVQKVDELPDGEFTPEVSDAGRGRDGLVRSRKRNGWKRRDRLNSHWASRGDSRRFRDSSEVEKRYGLKRYLRDQLAGDD